MQPANDFSGISALASVQNVPLRRYTLDVLGIPRELVWDYPSPPKDERWRARRIALFFPQFGRDRETVAVLYRYLDELQVPPGIRELVVLYAREHGLAPK